MVNNGSKQSAGFCIIKAGRLPRQDIVSILLYKVGGRAFVRAIVVKDLPEPLGPIKAKVCAASRLKLIFCTKGFEYLCVKTLRFCTLSTDIIFPLGVNEGRGNRVNYLQVSYKLQLPRKLQCLGRA